MSMRFEFGLVSDRFAVPASYVPGALFDQEFGERPSKPGNGALVIGDPYASAYCLEGTPAELREFLSRLAALLPPDDTDDR